MIARLMDAGVDVFRLNFSHGSHDSHGRCLELIRRAAREKCKPVAILQDLQGAKIRVGDLQDHCPVTLAAGAQVRLAADAVPGVAARFATTYHDLPDDVRPGDAVLLDDGRIQLIVKSIEKREVLCEVVIGGILREHKGINLPHTPLKMPPLTQKDRDDLRFGLDAGVDFVGLSFVRCPQDISSLREEARRLGKEVFVIAKIERSEAVDAIEDIIRAADGIMIARGDLGVETSCEQVPLLQKRILRLTGRLAKPDITATEMLESMIVNPRPTRAEAADVANAVFDGTDALMLSAETAIGNHPEAAVRTMARIAAAAEEYRADYELPAPRPPDKSSISVAEATVHSACAAAREIGAAAVAVFTLSGRTAFLVSAARPDVPIFAFTPHDDTCRRLALAWGVQPVHTEMVQDTSTLIAVLNRHVREHGLVELGEKVVILTGAASSTGATNIMRILEIQDD